MNNSNINKTSTNTYIIRREVPEDYQETENLVREAFWNVYRPGCSEHYVLHTFRGRKDFVPELDLVMEKAGKIIGQIMYVKAAIESDAGRSIPREYIIMLNHRMLLYLTFYARSFNLVI